MKAKEDVEKYVTEWAEKHVFPAFKRDISPDEFYRALVCGDGGIITEIDDNNELRFRLVSAIEANEICEKT